VELSRQVQAKAAAIPRNKGALMTTTYRTDTYYDRAHAETRRSLGDLFGDLTQNAGLLARQEAQLAKIEMQQKAKAAAGDIAMVIVGATLANAALLFLLTAVMFGLAEIMSLWLAALIVGLIAGLIAALMVYGGLKALKNMDPLPQQTLTSLEEDKEWLTRQMN
jgi:hypothetical protein